MTRTELVEALEKARAYLREKNEIIKAYCEASGGMLPDELAYHFQQCRQGCPHYSLTGAEGPIEELGRMPKFWKCDACGTIIKDEERFVGGSVVKLK